MHKKISIVIVNYNGRKFLKRLFETIQGQTFQDFEIIFVDNASKDDSVGFVRVCFPQVKIIQSQNLGYGSGCNIGAKNAAGEYLVFLNEDMYLPEDFLENILTFRESLPQQEKIGAISCKMVDFDANPDEFPPTLGANVDLFGFPVKNRNPRDIFVVSGSPFFIKKEVFERIGGYNKLIFIYGEDVDLSWRLRILGFSNFITKATHIHHFAGGATGNFSPKKIADIVFGAFISIFTNFSTALLALVLPLFLLSLIMFYLLLTIIKLNPAYFLEIAKKKDYFLENLKKASEIRKAVQKKRVCNDILALKHISLIPAFFLNNPLAKIGENYSVKNT